jgi:accessory colonization factor AcfC
MNFVAFAGAVSRRESAGRHTRFRRRRGVFNRSSSSAMGVFDKNKVADQWIAEYGEEAAWHAAQKIGELMEWEDHEGAYAWVEVLAIIEERIRARKSSGD